MDRDSLVPVRPSPKERQFTYVSESDEYDEDLAPAEFSLLSCALGTICFPFTLLCSCYTVKEKNEAVILRWGKFDDRVSTPGCHWSNCWGRELRVISTAKQTIELPVTKIIDLHGNPLNVSAIVTFYFNNSRKSALNVVLPHAFVRDQAQAVMKQVVSRYPYETHDGSPSLKSESMSVGKEMVEMLQSKVNVAGAKIISFDLNELAYAPEIAAGMLRRQQAKALVDARKTIVEGAVEIASEALGSLQKKGISLDDKDKTKLVTNLLTVICADKDAQPTVPL
jgi:regulator of protease activity HflC (stomatin/prohibitin superfamily)